MAKPKAVDEQLIKFIKKGAFEYIQKNKSVTVERSIRIDNAAAICQWIKENIVMPDNSFWVAFHCETCREHCGKDYCHLCITDNEQIKYDTCERDIIAKS